jgi:hypothetical protein
MRLVTIGAMTCHAFSILAKDKYTCLLRKLVNYTHKKFYNNDTWLIFKNFFLIFLFQKPPACAGFKVPANHRYLTEVDCLSFVMCPLQALDIQGYFCKDY